MQIRESVAVVTGAGGTGCGRAIARRLASEGALVVVSARQEEGGMETIRQIGAASGRATFRRCDVSLEDDVRDLIAFTEASYGAVDVVVNNASAPAFPEVSFDDSFANIKVDLLGAMYVTRHAIDAFRRHGRAGAVINVGSTSALRHGGVASKAPGYDVAKAGIVRLTTCLGDAYRSERIRVNCLVPHWIATDAVVAGIAAMNPQERVEWGVPERLISVEEITDAVVRLVEDTTLAGRVMVLCGGQPPQLVPVGDPGYRTLERIPEA